MPPSPIALEEFGLRRDENPFSQQPITKIRFSFKLLRDRLGPRNTPDVENKLQNTNTFGQGCFVCMETPTHGQYAIAIPCKRPTSPRRIAISGFADDDLEVPESGQSTDEKSRYWEVEEWEKACEDDSAIWERLVETCFRQVGIWKRLVPYYGVVEVVEVQFKLEGHVDGGGRYPVIIEPLNIEKVIKNLRDYVARYEPEDYCMDTEAQVAQAESTLWRVDFRHRLTECAQRPHNSNGLKSLEGFAQPSCMYALKGQSQVNLPSPGEDKSPIYLGPLRGLKITLGWQKERIGQELPIRLSFVWLGFAIIWFSVVVFTGLTGNFGIVLGFAQVVAASLTLLVTKLSN